MKNIAIIILALSIGANAQNKSIESIKNTEVKFEVKSDIKLPKVSIKKENTQQQDVVYKFNQVKDDLWRLKSDTTWLRSNIQRLESDARQIQQTG